MPTWLVEGEPVVYAVLGIAFLGSVVGWWRTRKRRFAVVAGIAAALLLGYFLLDKLVESDGEQMVRKVTDVATAISAHDLDAAFRSVSESFDRPPRNKASFRKFCDDVLRAGNVTEIRVWDLAPVDESRPQRTGSVEFHFKVRGRWGESPPNYFGKVTFTLDGDGQWRVKTFDVHDSLNQSRTPIGIPGW
jgi:hypothetical protein